MTTGGGLEGSDLGPAERYGLRLVLFVAAAAAIAIPFATLTFNVISEGPLIGWDGTIADALNGWVHERPVVLGGLEAISWMGDPPVLFAVVGFLAGWSWTGGRRRLAVFLAATSASGALLGTLVKIVVDRPRPIVDHPVSTGFGKSFPSGHAMHATIAYGAIALVLLPMLSPRARKLLVAGAVIAITAIGSSRLFLGLHFLTDVVGGFVLGGAWLAIGAATFQTWQEEVPDSDQEDDRLGFDPGTGGARSAGEGSGPSGVRSAGRRPRSASGRRPDALRCRA